MTKTELILVNELIAKTNQKIISKTLYIENHRLSMKIIKMLRTHVDELKDIIDSKDETIKSLCSTLNLQKEHLKYWKEETNKFSHKYFKWYKIYKLPFIARLKFLFNSFYLNDNVLEKYID